MLRQEKITNAFVGAGSCLSHLLLEQFVTFKRYIGVFLFPDLFTFDKPSVKWCFLFARDNNNNILKLIHQSLASIIYHERGK